MSSLANQQQNLSFPGLLQIPGGITTTLQQIQDGNGNATGLSLSSAGASVTTSSTFQASKNGTTLVGALPRLISDGFGDLPTVKDFGAVGDGTTDDTAAFTAAIAATPLGVAIPAGSYKITGTVTGNFYSFGVVTIVTGTVTTIQNLTAFSTSTGSSLIGTIGSGTGAVQRTVAAKINETVSVLDFGADPTGVADSSAAFQAAVNASKQVLVPKGTYLIDTTVNIPASVHLVGQGMYNVSNIVVNNAITCFNITGDSVTISNLFITHTGDGIIINAAQVVATRITLNTFYASSATSVEDLIYTSGSYTWIRQNSFNSARPFGFCIDLDRTGIVINIESHIELNLFGGAGSAIYIQSSDNSARPEGVYITNNSFIGLHENLRINEVLQCVIANNVFDQGGAYNVIFNPTNSGINNVQLTGNYFSTPSQLSLGVAVVHLNPTVGIPLAQIGFTDNTFSFTGVGVALYAPATSITFIGNSFVAIGDTAIGLNGVSKAVISGNTFDSITTANLVLTDGATGGPFSVDANQFWPSATCTFTITDALKFLFNQTNSGYKLSGWATASTTSTTTVSGGTLNIPHGLGATPDINKVNVSANLGTLVVSAGMSVNVIAVTSTNIQVQVYYTVSTSGTFSINAFSSL